VHAFECRMADSFDHAVELLMSHPSAVAVAGGQSLIQDMRQGKVRPEVLVDISSLRGDGLQWGSTSVTIDALYTHQQISATPLGKHLHGLQQCAGSIGDRQVRNWGTLGGSLAYNDPSADYSSAMLALDAIFITTHRRIFAADFFRGPYQTALQHGELITAVEIELPSACAYQKVTDQASGWALAGVFVVRRDASVRVAITGSGREGVFRSSPLEAVLSKSFTPEAVTFAQNAFPLLKDDFRASASYRRQLNLVLTQRCVRELER
jgi:carbon-monoxide dehydrogenase medium subunit